MNRLQDVNRNKQKRESERKSKAGQFSNTADYAMRSNMRPNMQRGMRNMRCDMPELQRSVLTREGACHMTSDVTTLFDRHIVSHG